MTLRSRHRFTSWYVPIGLFALALIPRLPALGKFLTRDEPLWVDRSRHFLAGLLDPTYVCQSPFAAIPVEQIGLACTLQTGHPGVTTMWTGSLGIIGRYLADGLPGPLFDYARSIQTNPLDLRLIAPLRLPTVLLTSLFVVAVYWLVSRLFDNRMGLIAGLLLALEPFHVALSRVIHNDALLTIFMTLSLLTGLIYWGQRGRIHWLVASGALAGLAFLSKSTALFLIPFMALVGGWSLVDRYAQGESPSWRRVGTTVVEWMLWFNCAGVVIIALWPAMWVNCAIALRAIFSTGSQYAETGFLQYFIGTVSLDPGPLFYPVTWLLRSSPLTWVGLVAAVICGRRRSKGKDESRGEETDQRPLIYKLAGCQTSELMRRYGPLLLAYTILFVTFVTLGAKKDNRYLLPVYPILNVLAAFGLVQIANFKIRFLSLRAKYLRFGILIAFILIFQGALITASFPYYFTYYNPLLGGARIAQKLVTIGWGEGLDLAAAYLNQKPNAAGSKVTAWHRSAFAPFFHGQSNPGTFFSAHEAMPNDYLVFYRDQLQRQLINPELLAYFQKHYEPEYVVNLKGVDYALIYAVPIEHHTAQQLPDEVAGNKLILHGYRQANTKRGVLPVQLIWENRGMSEEDGLWAALQYASGSKALSWQPCTLAPGFSQAETGQPGALAESLCELQTVDLGPGMYGLRIGLGPAPNSQTQELSEKLAQPEEVADLLAPGGEWWVSVPEVGAPTLVVPDKD
jgi:4-amino-4-deoxy-L-arabinose transferase-like glycosyltransferase